VIGFSENLGKNTKNKCFSASQTSVIAWFVMQIPLEIIGNASGDILPTD
jgi:hypothetical protein